MPSDKVDLRVVNGGAGGLGCRDLGRILTAVEPALWAGLIATYIRNRGFNVKIIDAEAERFDAIGVADRVGDDNPHLVAMIVYGHQPSASTQMMGGAGIECKAIKRLNPDQKIIIIGGHVAALPDRTLREEAVDFACNGEGPVTVEQLLTVLKNGSEDYSKDEGLVWRDGKEIRNNIGAKLITDLDKDLPRSPGDLLPMKRYRAHNWQCFGDLESRKPYASIYTTLVCPYRCHCC